MVLLHLNSCEVKEGAHSSRCGGRWRSWATMALRVLFLLTLLLLAEAQKWPVSGDCRPCQCSYKTTSFGRMRTVNCSRRGLRTIPASLPDDLMALDLSWNSLDVENLRQHLCKFQSLQLVSLFFADLTTLSDIFKECSAVLELNLTGNRLAQIDSQTFIGLKNLRRLLGLEVESVVTRDVFRHLTNLKDLDVIFHGENLPKGLFDDMVIQSLNLVVTQASSLPQRVLEFGQKTLNTLQLIGERITTVNEDLLDGLCVLRKLYLVMPSVQLLPAGLFQSQRFQPGNRGAIVRLANLQEVEISGIRTLPAMLFNRLVTLETLQLKEIGSFPEMGFLNGAVNLRTLVITGSKLTRIPADWFRQLYSLETLTLSGLQLDRLHEDAFRRLLSLTYLDLSNNNLDHITAKTLTPLNKTLETLILRGNFLTEVNSDVLGWLGSLRLLDVSENRLTSVYSNSFAGMTYLSTLYLNNNRLTSLPKDLFQNLLQLESLSLSDNYFVEFPVAILQLKKSLTSLDLDSNELGEVPAFQLCQFVYLQVINMMSNPLFCGCPLLAFSQCQISVNGQCESPAQYSNTYIQDVEVPSSCAEEFWAKQISDPLAKAPVFLTTQSTVSSSSSISPSQTDQETSTGTAKAAEKQAVNMELNSVLNRNTSNSNTATSEENVTIVRNLFTEKSENSELTKDGALDFPEPENSKMSLNSSSENTENLQQSSTNATYSADWSDRSDSSLQSDRQNTGDGNSAQESAGPSRGYTSDRMMGDSPGQASDTSSKPTSEHAVLDSFAPASQKSPQPTQSLQIWQGYSTNLPTSSESPPQLSEGATEEEKPETVGRTGSVLITKGISVTTSSKVFSENKKTYSTSTAISVNSSTDVLSFPKPAHKENYQTISPQTEEPGSNENENEGQERIALNFIISAAAAFSFFGCSVLGIILVRRWQQKGTYTISQEDTEMNNLMFDGKEAAAVFPIEKESPGGIKI